MREGGNEGLLPPPPLRALAPPNASRMAGGPLQSACEAAAASIHRLAELAEAMRVGARTDLLELLLAEWSVERAGYRV